MALRVWLPLLGNLNNQGVSNITIENRGAVTVNSAGKIGQCMSFNGTGTSNIRLPAILKNTDNFSITCWVKFNSTVNQCLFSQRTGVNAAGFTIFYLNGTDIRLDEGAATQVSGVVSANNWYHIACCRDAAKTYIYINGVYKGGGNRSNTSASNVNANYSFIGGSQSDAAGSTTQTNANMLNGCLNDYRIYDHCLSAAEVHEISQGLVLHYKLDGGINGNENFILASHKITSGGDASGITRTYMADDSLKVVAASGNSNWCSIGFAKNSNDNVGTKLAVGDTYTISCDVKVENGTTLPTVFINSGNSYKRLQGTIIQNQWMRAYYTSTWADPGTGYGNISLHLGFSGIVGTYYFKNFKLEKSSFPTVWSPAPADGGINLTQIQDSSGYGHNGTVIGTPTLSSNTARYSSSMQFNGSNQAVNAYRGAMVTDAITSSCWAYMPTWTASSKTLMSCVESQGWGLKPTGNSLRFVIVVNNSSNTTLNATSSKTYASLSAGWHMFTGTCDGTVAKFYIDGELEATSSTITKGVIQYNSGNSLFIGAEASGSASTPGSDYFAGNISDTRIYATALSQADIKQLYNTAAKVDNLGGLHTFEFQEKGPNKIYKTGITQGQEISEIDGMSNLKYDPNVYIEPDGSAWVRIFHHVNPTSNKFASSDTFTTGVYKDENRWFNFDLCNYIDKWEFIAAVKYTSDVALEKYRWIQSVNPYTATFEQTKVANITKISTGYNTYPFGGFYHVSGNTWFAANNGTNNNWMGAVGCWNAWNGGIPGWQSSSPSNVVTTGTIDIYLRIDNITTTMPTIAKSTKNNIWVGHNLIER